MPRSATQIPAESLGFERIGTHRGTAVPPGPEANGKTGEMNACLKTLLWTALLLFSASVKADGLPVEHGRYAGKVLVFRLTAVQKRVIAHYRSCQLEHFKIMNVYTPYVFDLSTSQHLALKKATGLAPGYFAMIETLRGDDDAGPFWNMALRFSENEFEIPTDLVINERDSLATQITQGWQQHNPCFPRRRTDGISIVRPETQHG